MKHIKKIKPASQEPGMSSGLKGDKPEPRMIKDLRPCIPVDGN